MNVTRAKIVNHGPYLLSNGETLVLVEYTNLYDRRGIVLRSATELNRLPQLGIARR
jgi:hypothetical protein